MVEVERKKGNDDDDKRKRTVRRNHGLVHLPIKPSLRQLVHCVLDHMTQVLIQLEAIQIVSKDRVEVQVQVEVAVVVVHGLEGAPSFLDICHGSRYLPRTSMRMQSLRQQVLKRAKQVILFVAFI